MKLLRFSFLHGEFKKTNAWNLPVIDRYHRFKGLGFKSTIFQSIVPGFSARLKYKYS